MSYVCYVAAMVSHLTVDIRIRCKQTQVFEEGVCLRLLQKRSWSCCWKKLSESDCVVTMDLWLWPVVCCLLILNTNHYAPAFVPFLLMFLYVQFSCTLCFYMKWLNLTFSVADRSAWNVPLSCEMLVPDHIVLNGSPLTGTMCVKCVAPTLSLSWPLPSLTFRSYYSGSVHMYTVYQQVK